jgi:MoaA/NifB/PqqE/SkfB family radical SAM enzyme
MITPKDLSSIDNIKKTNICHLPWTHLSVSITGEYAPCCVFKGKITEKNGEAMNIRSHSLRDAHDSEYLKNLRNKFLSGDKPAECEKCWQQEAAGKESQRIMQWKDFFPIANNLIKKNINKISSLQINWGNICNLKCRTCSYEYSSQWGNEIIKNIANYKISTSEIKKHNKLASWPKTHKDQFFLDLKNNLSTIVKIENTGGEPLLSIEHIEMLEMCVKLGYSKNISLYYNTNGTIFPGKHVLEYWKKFKKIIISFSIDNIGKKFEYARYPAKWDQVEKNIVDIKNYGLSNIYYCIATATSVLNIFYLDEIYEFEKKIKSDAWFVQMVGRPSIFDVRNIPHEIKTKINEKYKDLLSIKAIKTSLNIMNSSTNNTVKEEWREELLEKIQKIDRIRNEDFKIIHPELFDLINK